ncbi:hypothetical protein [uncultured Sphingomonas sp.]|uniref:hypothetical protein n=1 Tax=uncultured Sphingomonas sp. TaxID=158754 RepID=UPI0025E216CF|nr:hypothetical protein [uncultured Sphingomonas sp.]
MTTQTPDAVREAYMQGQVDMRERAAQLCDQRGAEEQEGFGLVRGTQNYFRARNAIRDLEIASLDSRAGDAGEGQEVFLVSLALSKPFAGGTTYSMSQLWRTGGTEQEAIDAAILFAAKEKPGFGVWNMLIARVPLSATPAPAVDAECDLCHGLNTSCPNGCEIIHDAVDAVPAGEVVERLKETAEDLRKIGWHKDRQNVLDAIASLSHGEGRK